MFIKSKSYIILLSCPHLINGFKVTKISVHRELEAAKKYKKQILNERGNGMMSLLVATETCATPIDGGHDHA